MNNYGLIPGKKFSFSRNFTQNDFNKFAEISDDKNPIHIDPEFSSKTKFGRTVAHGMFLYGNVCQALEMVFPKSAFIQIYQDLIFPSPTYTDENVIVDLQITNTMPSKEIYDFETTIRRSNGELGLQGTTRVLKISPSVKEKWIPKNRLKENYENNSVESLKGLKLGQTDTICKKITSKDLKGYISLLKSNNLIYSDMDYVKSVGFDNLIVPGPLIGGIISQQLGTRLPGRGTNWLKLNINFLKPIYVDEEIKSVVTIVRIRPEKDLINLKAICYDNTNNIVVDSKILVLVKDLEPL